ncbi:hypothetical protein DSAG12_03430 [Promethearchaeum syntrophicum]|uniref:Histidine kinase N-terminal 7TM region domain-containing protein n=1 Tax=Promethearchaeum syntrophicum TaxID=2594042 RepID=A0A5B9DFM6_9ARCH|nr:hypothetical protein [Candidatus Prometheoarchaeum syntrophicum]QEE17593.1 hypothetical protein DSAG12_03430 [Candidatus Prometheoarchaeum syntrophicum]
MVLNWSAGVIIAFISLIPSTAATVLTLIQYSKDKYTHLKYLMGMWACLTIWILFQAIGDLLLSIPLHLICFYSLIGMGYFANLFVDSITRDSVDLFKMIIMTIASSAVFIFSFAEDAVIIDPDAVTPYPTMHGNFRIASLIHMVIFILVVVYGNLKVFLYTPKHLKFYSFLNLFGAYLWGVQPLWIQFTDLEKIFPGLATGSMAIGTLIIALVLIREPKLAYILPFKAYRILIMDTNSGIILYKHDWNELKAKSSENIFSGMLQAISTMFDHTINKGNVREINFDEAVLSLKISKKIPIACILISSNITKTLRTSFENFADEVFQDYEKLTENAIIQKNYEKGKNIIENHFPFVPQLGQLKQ